MYSAVRLTVLIGLLVTWTALAAAYFSPYPIGFYVTAFAFAAYVAAQLPSRAAVLGRAVRAGSGA
ncbi:MAG TPA: hypothetical protein VGS97_17335 [Actinocrinis sp.]|uniref:hypothetical protein n=1 Tax=Actinocrinis sp. TaxID=1920516 RepID=UPI002DDDB38B|nr:hypothetical protein [Actinocrinis sp.]HEV2345865.1 hypothetical protein [Actinocrinis sp.]